MSFSNLKKLLAGAFMLMIGSYCQAFANPTTQGTPRYSIIGTIKGLDDRMIYLRKESHIVSGFVMKIDIDSTLSKDGYFRFDGVMEEPSYAYLEIYGHHGPGPRRFILDNSNFTVTLNKYDSTVYNNPHIEGGYSNKILREFYDFIGKEYAAENDYKNRTHIIIDSVYSKNTSTKDSLEYYQQAYDRKLGEFIKNNPNEFVSLHLLKSRPQLSMSDKRGFYDFLSEDIKQSRLGRIYRERELYEKKYSETKVKLELLPKVDIHQNEFDLADIRGKKIYLISYCVQPELGILDDDIVRKMLKVYKKVKKRKNSVLIGLVLDQNASVVKKFIDENNIPWKNLHAFENDFINRLGLGGRFAEMVVVSPKGILQRWDAF